MFNLWDYIVAAIIWIIMQFMNSPFLAPPGTDLTTTRTTVQFTQTFIDTAVLMVQLVGPVLSMFNWRLAVAAMAWNGSMMLIQVTVSIWLFVKKIIGAPVITS